MNPSGSSLADWLLRLASYSPHEIELGLDRVLEVLKRLKLALPERIFHISGTNGKGSSVAFAEALLSQSGASIGSYTSPHILKFNERICIDLEPASDANIIAAFERIDAARGDTPLTYFEFGTIAALVIFAARQLDVAILEIGMGGRLDAVNAVEPSAGLITNVSLDHCDWLGDDLESIAREKAGIMRAGKSTVYASVDAPESIQRHANDIGADLVLAGRDYSWTLHADGWVWQGRQRTLKNLRRPSLAGDFQIANAAGVLALLEAAGFEDLLDAELVNHAFALPALAGRLQRVDTDRCWILDVAHNPAAASVLADVLSADDFSGSTVAIIALLEDKDIEGVVTPLLEQVDQWIAVTADNARAIDASEIGRNIACLTNESCFAAESLEQAMEQARQFAASDDRILVTGSFYLVGPVLKALEIYSAGGGDT